MLRTPSGCATQLTDDRINSLATAGGVDRRRSPRIKCEMQATVQLACNTTPFRVTLLDYSATGLRFASDAAIEPNAPRAKWAVSTYSKLCRKCGVKTKKISNPITLELAKIIVDTSYYGWLINYAQLSNMIAIQHKVNFDEMWRG